MGCWALLSVDYWYLSYSARPGWYLYCDLRKRTIYKKAPEGTLLIIYNFHAVTDVGSPSTSIEIAIRVYVTNYQPANCRYTWSVLLPGRQEATIRYR